MEDLLTRPALGANVYGAIEAEQYDTHKRYASRLNALRVLDRMPKSPESLANVIAAYSQELFDAEAKRYPDDNDLSHWLLALSHRVEATVMWRIAELEAVSAAKLTHHASKDDMRGMVRAGLSSRLGETVIVKAQPAAPAQRVVSANVAEIAKQIRALRRECRFTVVELAQQVGIASRTVQRHEAGEVDDIRLRHVRQYERIFSEVLSRPVRLNTT